MEQKTTNFKQSFSGSVGAGMSSIFNASGKTYYILEHKVTSKYHKAGESQPIIIDNIVIGRDPSCQVRFDDNFSTVSRKHAAIMKDGNNWTLVQLSKTNTTYLNGTPVKDRWYLQNGDEIQLSKNGPKLGFIVPQGEKSLVKSIGMTARLNLFRQQALRPYKTAITVMSCVLLLAVLGLGGGLWYSVDKANKQEKASLAEFEKIKEEHAAKIKEITETTTAQLDQMEREFKNKMAQLEDSIKEIPRTIVASGDVINNSEIEKCLPNIYYIQANKIVVTYNYETAQVDDIGWSGTGFLLDDGRFVTARHVVEPWYYWKQGEQTDETMFELNIYAINGGDVEAYFSAYSSSGDAFTFKTSDYRCNRSQDEYVVFEDGITKCSLAPLNNTDWAYTSTNKTGGLSYASSKSNNMDRGTKLTVLGFPLGIGANAEDDINPIYGSAIVSREGLQDGLILTTDTNYEHGNSGGPVFYTNSSGKLQVIGIVSAGAGRNIGFIVPISSIQ
jgi:pSer/pThr/pTyr-binding forkhead associated (FHA) protein